MNSRASDCFWTPLPDGVFVDVRLTPRGGRDAIKGVARRADGRVVLKARVRAAPSKGEANAALCRLLAAAVGVAPRQATLVAGATARGSGCELQAMRQALRRRSPAWSTRMQRQTHDRKDHRR
jgi:uncharacterized protein